MGGKGRKESRVTFRCLASATGELTARIVILNYVWRTLGDFLEPSQRSEKGG